MSVELLSPAGNMQSLTAAVQLGADAVYFGWQPQAGVSAFNARAGAQNIASITEAVNYCHLRGVKAYLTVNTLVRDDEYGALDTLLVQALDAGVDAFIIQDIAVAARVREIAPLAPLHASTQAGVMGAYGARWLAMYGFERVVAARECSLEDIGEMANAAIGVEVFAHGALCAAYSGRCLFSSMVGGRSGNRGRCAQPCRLPYRLGEKEGYILSPGDLCLLGKLPQLIRAGACALKIEGRARRPEYVAVATAAYRRALDAACLGMEYDPDGDIQRLMAVFNRGDFTHGHGFGDKSIYNITRPNNAGVLVGHTKGGKTTLYAALNKGDSIECRPSCAGFAAQEDFPAGNVRLPQAKDGDTLYRTNDTALIREVRDSYSRETKHTSLDARLVCRVGEPASLTLGSVCVEGAVADKARSHPLTQCEARGRIGKFAQTPIILRNFTLDTGGEDIFMPVADINALRRAAVTAWEERQLDETRPYPRPCAPIPQPEPLPSRAVSPPRLAVQSEDMKTLAAILKEEPEILAYYAPCDWRGGAAQTPHGAFLVLPFWLEGVALARAVESARRSAAGFVVASFAALQAVREHAGDSICVTDYHLHAFSARGAKELINAGALRVTLSPEMTLKQMLPAAYAYPCEAVVHARLPLMTLRLCPVRGHGMCGANCGIHEGVCLTDRMGERFPLKAVHADDGCRCEILNAHTLSMLAHVPRLMQSGLEVLRVITNDPSQALAYVRAMRGEPQNEEAGGFTRGHFFRAVE